MAEILHQLIGSLAHYLQGYIHPRWCRISAINSSIFAMLVHWKVTAVAKIDFHHHWQHINDEKRRLALRLFVPHQRFLQEAANGYFLPKRNTSLAKFPQGNLSQVFLGLPLRLLLYYIAFRHCATAWLDSTHKRLLGGSVLIKVPSGRLVYRLQNQLGNNSNMSGMKNSRTISGDRTLLIGVKKNIYNNWWPGPSCTSTAHPWKLTWNPKTEVWKMMCLFNWVIFRFPLGGCEIPNLYGKTLFYQPRRNLGDAFNWLTLTPFKKNKTIHPWKLTRNLKKAPWKRTNIYKPPIFGFFRRFMIGTLKKLWPP